MIIIRLFTAAKHLDSAAAMAKEQKLLEEATTLYEKASNIRILFI
jgi:hypothetical protein